MQSEDKLFRNRWLETNNTFCKFSLLYFRAAEQTFGPRACKSVSAQKCFATLVTCNKHERARKFGPLVDYAKFPSTFVDKHRCYHWRATSAIRVSPRGRLLFLYFRPVSRSRNYVFLILYAPNLLSCFIIFFFLRNEGELEKGKKKRKRRKCSNFLSDFLESFKKKVFIFLNRIIVGGSFKYYSSLWNVRKLW